MGYFPFFVDIEGKNGLIVGGGSVAVHKIRKLLPFRPKLKVVSPALLPELIEIAQNSEILLIQREFQEEDLQDVTFVIASSENRSLNARCFHTRARIQDVIHITPEHPAEQNLFCPHTLNTPELPIKILCPRPMPTSVS